MLVKDKVYLNKRQRQGEYNMNGYVMNITKTWMNAMKRAVGPGAKIPLAELYIQYGKKHNLAEGDEFIEWLKNVKLKDHDKWSVVVNDVSEETKDSIKNINKSSEDEVTKTESHTNLKPTNVVPMVQQKMSVADLVGLSVRQAKAALSDIKDLNLLKYALQEANQLTGKDSLCILLRKRIKEIQIAR